MIRINRLDPALPAQAMKTYQIVAPRDREVVAACEQAGCWAWRNGWETAVDEATDLGQSQAVYIRTQSRRTFTEARSGALTVFRFEAGQRCFAEHRTRPEVYRVRRGDWRGDLGETRVHTRPGDWVDDFANHQDRLAERLRQG